MIDTQPASQPVTNSVFLQHLALGIEPGQALWVDHFIGDPGKGNWGGIWYLPDDPRRPVVDGWSRFNTYFSVAGLVPVEDKGVSAVRRRMANFGRLAALVLDDFDLDSLMGQVSYVIETSPGKHQVGVFLDPADPDCADHNLVRKLTAQIVVKAGLRADESGNNMVRLVRLPVGQNQKPRESGHWDHRLTKWAPDVRHTLEDAAAVFGVDLDVVKAELVAEPAVRTGVSQASNAVDRVAELTRNILNGDNLHDSLRDLAAHKIACGMVEGAVVNDLRALCSLSSEAGTERMKDREADIQRAVEGAKKFAPKAPVYEVADEAVAPAEPDDAFPADLLSPPGILGDLIAWQLRTAFIPQPVMALASAIVMCMGALSQSVGMGGTRTNLYVLILARTGTGKENGRKALKRSYQAASIDNYISESPASGAALDSRLAVEPCTVALIDEFGEELAQQKGGGGTGPKATVGVTLLKMSSSADQVVKGTEYANRKVREQADIFYPCLSVLATSTPDKFYKVVTADDVSSGLLNRFVIFEIEGEPPEEVDQDDEPEPCPEHIVAWMKAAAALSHPKAGNVEGPTGAKPAQMRVSPPAKALRDEFKRWVREQRKLNESTQTDDLFVRCVTKATQMAGMLACTKLDAQGLTDGAAAETLEIDFHSMAWAIAIEKNTVLKTASQIARRVGGTLFGNQRLEVLRLVTGSGAHGMTVRDLARLQPFKGLQERERNALVGVLVADGLICLEGHKGMSGKIREAYRLAKYSQAEPG